MIQAFHAEHPDVRIDISSSHAVGLPSTETDMAIVFDRPNIDDRVTDLLWMVRVAQYHAFTAIPRIFGDVHYDTQ